MKPAIPSARLRLECESMAHSRATLVELSDGRLAWCDELISNSGVSYDVVIVYSDHFPHERPRAFITSDIREGAPHRFTDGSLCLFPTTTDASLGCTAGVVRGRVALWILYYEAWQTTGSWQGAELAH